MKIAICISGHLRHYKNIKDKYESFISYLKNLGDVDIFVATWDKQNTLNSWSHAHGISNPTTSLITVQPNEVLEHFGAKKVILFDYDFHSSDYSPISFKNYTSYFYNWDKRGIGGNVINSSKMFFLINECNKLKKQSEYINNELYDVVFRIRPDYEFFDDKFDYMPLKHVNPQCIYSPKPYPDSPLIDDQFAFGDSKAMDLYSSTINTMAMCFQNKIFGNPETILNISCANIFNLTGITIQRVGCLGSDTTSFKR